MHTTRAPCAVLPLRRPALSPTAAAAAATVPAAWRVAIAPAARLNNQTTSRRHPSPFSPPPPMLNIIRNFFSSPSPEAVAMASQKAQKLIDENPVMVFSKSYCPYCKATKSLLSSLDADFKVVELDQESDGSAVQDALEEISGQRTVPNVYISKKHIGGNSDVQSLSSSGKLKALLTEAGALKA
ncbi:hypothetical protein LLEC1_04705 [Akanthomyces lecanii]|uniref:Glutaredoxin domain-containing protein n=1 Tax=Cordyceps confragosa TaxID=2714763 RepID=A0A179I6M8_CORDF|nr:hypothetical protein LLEC1_04705 [Akanthomyces lecanii]